MSVTGKEISRRRLLQAVHVWDQLRDVNAVMQERGIDFATILTLRAEAMEEIIEAARVVVGL
jgi:hypothetical protein